MSIEKKNSRAKHEFRDNVIRDPLILRVKNCMFFLHFT